MDNLTFLDALRAEGVRDGVVDLTTFCTGVAAFAMLPEFNGLRGDIFRAIGGTGCSI